jgi:ketosteroid isomerase-like protein
MDPIDPAQLVDRLAIAEVVNRYALHIDLHEIDQWVELFTEDAFFDEREFDSGLHVGHAAIRAYGEQLAATVKHAAHLMCNHVICDLTENSANGVVFALVEAEMKDGCRQRFQVRYEDTYLKSATGWKIGRRILRKGLAPESVT